VRCARGVKARKIDAGRVFDAPIFRARAGAVLLKNPNLNPCTGPCSNDCAGSLRLRKLLEAIQRFSIRRCDGSPL